MREPIKPEDIRKGDRIRREPRDLRSLRAVEYTAQKDGHLHGVADAHSDSFFLLSRPSLEPGRAITDEAVEVGADALGPDFWPRPNEFVQQYAERQARAVLTAALPYLLRDLVAVPKAALDELRRDHSADLYEIDLDTTVVKFLAAVDAANGDPR